MPQKPDDLSLSPRKGFQKLFFNIHKIRLEVNCKKKKGGGSWGPSSGLEPLLSTHEVTGLISRTVGGGEKIILKSYF